METVNYTEFFDRLETHFRRMGIEDDDLKYSHVLVALDDDSARKIMDIISQPPEEDKYGTIKRALRSRYYVSEEHEMHEELRHAHSKIPQSDIPKLWIDLLPRNLQLVLGAQSPGTPVDQLAEVADRFHEAASRNKEVALCRICYAKERGIVFLPCGHFVCCTECAPLLSSCVVCRKPLEKTLRAYLS